MSNLEKLILVAIQRISKWVLSDEKTFITELSEINEQNMAAEVPKAKIELQNYKNRNEELDVLIKKLYEGNAIRRISDRQFERLMKNYNKDQSQVEDLIKEYTTVIEENATEAFNADKFIVFVKKYTDFTELTDKMIYKFINCVEVHETGNREQGEAFHES